VLEGVSEPLAEKSDATGLTLGVAVAYRHHGEER